MLKPHQKDNLSKLAKLNSDKMTAINMLTVTNVSMPIKKVSDADGVLVILLITRELVKLHTNVEVSKLENHTISLAELISEPLIARVMLVILELKNAHTLMMDHSQILDHALKFANKISHMLNAIE